MSDEWKDAPPKDNLSPGGVLEQVVGALPEAEMAAYDPHPATLEQLMDVSQLDGPDLTDEDKAALKDGIQVEAWEKGPADLEEYQCLKHPGHRQLGSGETTAQITIKGGTRPATTGPMCYACYLQWLGQKFRARKVGKKQ